MQLDFNIANIRVYHLYCYFIKQTRFSSKNKLKFENISAKNYISLLHGHMPTVYIQPYKLILMLKMNILNYKMTGGFLVTSIW